MLGRWRCQKDCYGLWRNHLAACLPKLHRDCSNAESTAHRDTVHREPHAQTKHTSRHGNNAIEQGIEKPAATSLYPDSPRRWTGTLPHVHNPRQGFTHTHTRQRKSHIRTRKQPAPVLCTNHGTAPYLSSSARRSSSSSPCLLPSRSNFLDAALAAGAPSHISEV